MNFTRKEINSSRVYYDHIILPTEITFFDLSNSKNNKIIFIGFSNLQRNMYTGYKKIFYRFKTEDYFNDEKGEKIGTYERLIPKDIKLSKNLKVTKLSLTLRI